mmetsp:Transcript_26209/g.42024  ORF Transcript_26209/g.42024 Transcript_26209/m.42024 type:complete len:218 (-) Transcript_26209:944-1597(-)
MMFLERPLRPPRRLTDCANWITSLSSPPSASNMNSSGTSGTSWSSSSSAFSSSLSSSSSSSSLSSSSSALSWSWSWSWSFASGGGGGGGGGGCCSSSSGGATSMSTLLRGMMTRRTACLRSSALTLLRPSSAASDIAALTAKSSARCPITTPRMHSCTRYSICVSEISHSLSHSRASRICVRAPSVASWASATALSAVFWKFIAESTAITRSSMVST